ncbi:MAG: hypothetical protein IPG54_00950 [Sphingomonadales bacterium]|jgi:hypothetical protein|nr:hypothetical protein [Sphingomonadales bacterium]MBK9003727.1 hypothetical protein [Sphingomonadales bacterium]MBK9268901.1 hypothetical protein [Sphingomonadales bacterium]MBP6434582.1 hypothetical protein [Sphingorhabdus sp.]
MKKITGSIASALLGLSLTATPAQACWTNAEQDAARIANMNQMLMVSALRCRFGKDNFLSDYNRFVRNNNDVLASQHAIIKARYARTMGQKAAFAELDRFMIALANYYGGGHGDPDCGKLEKLSGELSNGRQDAKALATIADEVVGVPRQAAQACSVTIASRR